MTDDRLVLDVAQRWEGSRFAAWQLYRLAAGGSREYPTIRNSARVDSCGANAFYPRSWV